MMGGSMPYNCAGLCLWYSVIPSFGDVCRTALFTEQITGLVDDAAYSLFQKEMLRQPDRGNVIPQSGGLRKIRMRLAGRGKSGGARVIYLHLPKYDTIVLFYLYTKAQRENLSPEQLRRLRDAPPLSNRNSEYETKRN